MIGNITDAERLTLQICAERNGGACHCAATWGYPKDAYPACERLLVRVKAGAEKVRTEGV